MIKTIHSNTSLIYVNSSGSQPYINMNNPSAGMVRYNGNSSQLEVYDGSSWMSLNSSVSLGVDSRLETVVNWAMNRMSEEAEEARLRKENPLLQDAYEQYKVTVELVKKHNIGETL